MTIHVIPLSKSLTTTNLVVDSNVDMSGYDFTADNVNANQANVDTVHATTLATDHIKEHTGSHTIVLDNTCAAAALSTTGAFTSVGAITAKNNLKMAASNNVKIYVGEVDGTHGSLSVYGEATLGAGTAWTWIVPYGIYGATGTIRLSFTNRLAGADHVCVVKKNGVQTNAYNSDGAKTEDIAVTQGDVISVVCYGGAAGVSSISQLRIGYDEVAV